MNNRTLRRPMFRMGGSTGEGITSGLDMPKPDASRQDFQNGGDDMESRYNRAMDFIRSKQAPRRSNFNDFLINMGLDLVSRPKSGNIFSQVASSAKEPFAQFQARKEAYRSEDDKLNRALVGDIMEQMSEEEIARIKNQGSEQDKFAFEKQQTAYTDLITQQRDLEAQRKKIINEQGTLPPTADPLQKNSQIKNIEQQLEDNAKLQGLYKDEEEDVVRAAILKGIANGVFTFEDLITYDETGVPPREDAADGGRIGYQQGMMVQPAAPMMPASLPTDQGPAVSQGDSPVQDLSFEELRSRLPESVSNDIITLIANSQQALVEFANIQTEQDVKAFNRKYEVNLVLPQGA